LTNNIEYDRIRTGLKTRFHAPIICHFVRIQKWIREKNFKKGGKMMEEMVIVPSGHIKMSANPEAVRFWVKFLFKIWENARLPEGDPLEEDHAAWKRCAEKIKVAQSPEEYGAALLGFKTHIDQSDGESAPQTKIDFCATSCSASWSGTATEGRFVSIELTGDTLVVRWDTATGRESDFLGLPSTAKSFADGNRT
jgi:hypothetical protein